MSRLKAFLFDYLLILVYLVALAAVGSFLAFGPLADSWNSLLSSPVRRDLFAFVTTVLPVTLYFAISESRYGATWGKRRVGLEVVSRTGNQLSTTRSFFRNALKFLPWQMSHTALFHIPGFPVSPENPPGWVVVLQAMAWVLVLVYLAGLTSLGGRRTAYDRLSDTFVREREQPQ